MLRDRVRTRRAPEAPAPDGAVLVADGLTVGYGSVPVVEDFHLVVAPGEVVALLGPNGAGKTTTLMALSGQLPPMAGKISFAGLPRRAALHHRARHGLGFVPEERSVFRSMTTRDNLKIGDANMERALSFFPDLEKRLDVRAGLLSGGEQQMLTLGRMLSRRPSLILVDELSLGLAPKTTSRLLETVRRAADDGAAVVLVEQQIVQALRVSDRVLVLRRGRIALTGTSAEMADRMAEIEGAYLDHDDDGAPDPRATEGETV
jgi:branched-chain amino acid transport system ATP-binding protein